MDKIKKTRRDVFLMLLLMAACAFIYFYLIPTQIQMTKKVASAAFNPATFPRLLTICMFLTASVGFVISLIELLTLKKTAGEKNEETQQLKPHQLWAELLPFVVFLLVFFYAFLFKRVGFVLSTLLVPPLLLVVLGCRKWTYYAVVYGFAALMYLIFRYVLMVPLP